MAVNAEQLRRLEDECKKNFGSVIFLGSYSERRWVPHLNRYKDVIELAQSETELRNKLFKLRMDVYHNCKGLKTSNILLAPNFTKIFTEFPFGYPFGTHWFKISHVKVDPAENDFAFKVKIIRSVDPNDLNDSFTTSEAKKPQDVPDLLWSDVVQRVKFLLTVPNVVHFVRITLLIFLTTGMGLIVAVKSLAKFSLKVFRELSLFVHSSTPLLLGTMNVLSKIFGGILILLSMLWKDVFYLARRKIDPDGTPARRDDYRPTAPPARPALQYYNNQYSTPVSRQYGYDVHQMDYRRRGVVITELPNDDQQ